ncbi:hypothetical protein D5086_021610 [Populus alba]|uniref:Uncharacterized protein n=1 Tax=Populus alba TaxID=43335 RepID=A0ACC4BCN0_POPAL
MAGRFNEKSGISERIPLGSFNGMFNFTGSWQVDAAGTKSLAMVGHFIPLYKVQIAKVNLVLREEVKRAAVPYSWDPASLASHLLFPIMLLKSIIITMKKFIRWNPFITSKSSATPAFLLVSVVFSTFPASLKAMVPILSPLQQLVDEMLFISGSTRHLLCQASDIENYVKDIADQRFQDSKNTSIAAPLKYKDKDVTVIFRRRGGDDLEQSHAKWAETVQLAPDVINMTFTPIVSLLEGVPGIKHLARAIELYLEYKPPIEDLQYFLDFQIAKGWAPEQNNLLRKEPVCQSLQFSLMGPKLYISPDQTIFARPCQHEQRRFAFLLKSNLYDAAGAPKWQGPEEQDSRWFEPIKWKNFSHVSTAPIEYADTSIGDLSGVHIVTGAQLGVWDFGAKKCVTPETPILKSSRLYNKEKPSSDKKEDSHAGKLAKIVDMSEMSKGPQDVPGHWLVTGAKLGVDKGKIVLRVNAHKKYPTLQHILMAYTATVDRVATGTFFYQCVYLLLHPMPEVVEASAHCSGHFGYKSSTPYMPHLSLLYGDLTDDEKKEAQEKANILDESISGLSFPITRLALWKTDTEDLTLKSWEKIAECSLSPK